MYLKQIPALLLLLCIAVSLSGQNPDTISPVVSCPNSSTLYTPANTCVVNFTYTVTASDNLPDVTLDQTSGLASGEDFPLGTTTNVFLASDQAGNTASCSFTVTVVDTIRPVAICKPSLVVSLSIDDPSDCYGYAPGNLFGGVAMIPATFLNAGSYDNCGNIQIRARRALPYSTCIAGLNSVNGHMPCDDTTPDNPSEYGKATGEQQFLKFYCCESGTTQPVILRVYQLNSDNTISTWPNGSPVFTECTVSVAVTDKINPTCQPPANVTVSCADYTSDLATYGMPTALDNCCIDTVTESAPDFSFFNNICFQGTIKRSFVAHDCAGNTSSCFQNVEVTYDQNYYIRFPNDVIVTVCDGSNNFGEPQYYGQDCEQLAHTYEDEIFTVIPDACIKIERTWSIINWCTYNPNLPLIIIPNPNPSPTVNHPTNLTGPVVAEPGTPQPWQSTIVKINPTDPSPTNYASFWEADANGYKYKQIIKLIDTQAPELIVCPDINLTLQDTTTNNSLLWEGTGSNSDLSETPVNIVITGADACTGTGVTGKYLLYMDLDQDGIVETVVNSAAAPAPGTVNYNNINTPNFAGGTPVVFDKRNVPTNQKWQFALKKEIISNKVTFGLAWNTVADPDTYVIPDLPEGKHRMRWTMADNCSNESGCEHHLKITASASSGVGAVEYSQFNLFQNVPNPFSTATTIAFELPESVPASIAVFDANGRELYRVDQLYPSGKNEITVPAGVIGQAGVYFYKLETARFQAWRKMILLR